MQTTSLPCAGCLRAVFSLGVSLLIVLVPGCKGRPADTFLTEPRVHVASEYEGRLDAQLPSGIDEKDKVQPTALEGGAFQLALPNFDTIKAEQRGQLWCWAACISMFYQYGAIVAPQRTELGQIVSQFSQEQWIEVLRKDQPANEQSANLTQILLALCPDSILEWEREVTRNVYQLSLYQVTSDDMITALAAGKPMIVGLPFQPGPLELGRALTKEEEAMRGDGHACLVVGAKFRPLKDAGFWENLGRLPENVGRATINQQRIKRLQRQGKSQQEIQALNDERYGIVSVTIFDPWQGRGYREVPAQEFERDSQFLIGSFEACDILQAQIESARESRQNASSGNSKNLFSW